MGGLVVGERNLKVECGRGAIASFKDWFNEFQALLSATECLEISQLVP